MAPIFKPFGFGKLLLGECLVLDRLRGNVCRSCFQLERGSVVSVANGGLVTLYRVVQNYLEEFVRQFKWALSSRQVFEWQKMTRPETLTDI
jgi:hypothetical protein